MSKLSRFKAVMLVGLVLPALQIGSCINDLLIDILIATLFD
jgi:hypothetical protein